MGEGGREESKEEASTIKKGATVGGKLEKNKQEVQEGARRKVRKE